MRFQRLSLRKRLSARLLAFTLAEILIVIGIIGIVADMTIPTLVQSYQKQVAVTQLKKVYSVLTQAVNMSMVENGATSEWDMTLNSGEKFYETYLKEYLKVIKIIGYEDLSHAKHPYKFLNNSLINVSTGRIVGTVTYKIILSDGMLIGIQPKTTYTMFEIDINGMEKAPNTYGKDCFGIFINKKSQVLPNGFSDLAWAPNNCNLKNDPTATGVYCAMQIMRDGWKITYDW